VTEPVIDEEQRGLLPQPGWSTATEPFWFAAGRGELVVQRCLTCRTQRWPLLVACYHCRSTEWEWSPVLGTGRVFSYTWADFPVPADGQERNITVVELDGTDGPDSVRMMSWVVDVEREQLQCDLPVEVAFLAVDDEVSVPVWRPRD
jgi:uncharacterized OB-fold protein